MARLRFDQAGDQGQEQRCRTNPATKQRGDVRYRNGREQSVLRIGPIDRVGTIGGMEQSEQWNTDCEQNAPAPRGSRPEPAGQGTARKQ